MATIDGAWAAAWGGRQSAAGAPAPVTARAAQPVSTATHIGSTGTQEDDYPEKKKLIAGLIAPAGGRAGRVRPGG